MSPGVIGQLELPQIQHDKPQVAAQLVHIVIQESKLIQVVAVERMRQRIPIYLFLNFVQLAAHGAILFPADDTAVRLVGDFQHHLKLPL